MGAVDCVSNRTGVPPQAGQARDGRSVQDCK